MSPYRTRSYELLVEWKVFTGSSGELWPRIQLVSRTLPKKPRKPKKLSFTDQFLGQWSVHTVQWTMLIELCTIFTFFIVFRLEQTGEHFHSDSRREFLGQCGSLIFRSSFASFSVLNIHYRQVDDRPNWQGDAGKFEVRKSSNSNQLLTNWRRSNSVLISRTSEIQNFWMSHCQ